MYGLIWRILPGPWISKFIMALGLLAGAAALLWFFAFPAISPYMPFNDGAVDIEGAGGAGGGAGAEEADESGVVPTDSGAPAEESPAE
ncbi:hypothetical protein [Nocardiopsis sp. NPDC057823]|uniref:hypothetical protein n=1 Tax=Nocardiopsis TaxID=2013 RepID=UPI00367344D2